MEGVEIKPKATLKYLGVEIHSSLSWTPHVTERLNKCKFLLSKCRNLVSRTWGLSPQKMEWIYKSVIRPKLAYGAVVWAHNITKVIDKKLNGIQRLAMLPITQPLRSTPTAGLEAMLGWMPLSLYIEEAGMMTYLRNKELVKPGWDGVGRQKSCVGHLGTWRSKEEITCTVTYPRERRVSQYVWVEKPKRSSLWTHPIALYTDASKEKDNVGYSWIASIGDYVIGEATMTAKDISVYKGKMLAIKEALSWLRDHIEISRRNVIYCDSKSVVQVLNGCLAKDELTWDTLKLLREVNQVAHTSVQWVKGHSGIVGNEVVDMLAKNGALEAANISDVKPHMPATQREVKKLMHDHFLREWQLRWETLKSCRISKLFYPKIREDKSIICLAIKKLQALAQSVTGHGLFKKHIKQWNYIEDYQCSLCGEADEDSWHLWEWCPKLKKEREVIQRRIDTGLNRDLGILQLMNSEKIKSLRARNESLLSTI